MSPLMWVPLVFCYIAAGIASLSFLRYHIPLFLYPVYYLVPLFLAIYMPLSITFLLPIDYVSHNSSSPIAGFAISDTSILYMWKSNYWTTFLLTWVLLPVLKDYYDSGHYSKLKKLQSSLRANLKFHAVVLLISVAGAIYLMLEVGLTVGHLKSMIIALSHIYALVLALWLMAHGLIAIPRNRWLEGNLIQDLNHHYLKVPKLVDTLEDTKISFKEEVLQVLILEKNFTSPSVPENLKHRDWILSLAEQIPRDLRESVSRQYVYDEARSITRHQLTESFVTHLTYNFQTHLNKLRAHTSEYDTVLEAVTRLQTVIDARACENPQERAQIMLGLRSRLSPRANFYLQCHVKPVLARLLSLVLFSASFVIIQSEFFHSTKMSLLNTIIYKTGIHNHNLTQVICSAVVFLYMLFCSLNSLARLKIFNMYRLVPFNSDPVSACFYASYIARLTIPLSYNFITLFTSRNSIFEEWYGKSIHLTGLFNLMNNWIPRLLLIPIVLTTFNVYERLKKRLGFHSDFYGSWADFDDAEETSDNDLENAQNKRKDLIIVEAKRIVAMELNRRNHVSQATLRPFNLQNAADQAYEDNRRTFNDSLGGNLADRIDSYRDYDDTVPSGLWTRLGGAVSGIRDAVQTRLGRNASYRDDPIDSYEYDDDANDNLVL